VRLPGMSAPVTIYRTDVAITDEKALRFHQRVTYYFPQSASLSSQTLKIKIGSASLHGVSLQRMSLNASLPAGRINLGLSSRRPPMYVGGRGYIPFSGGYTYYYSLTDLATHGSITLKGVVYRVTGISWLDHQWGNWSWTATSGWTWMALQLNNGRQLSIFDVRSKSVPYLAASVLTPSGTTQTVRGVTVRSLGKWRSPHTRATYPSGWIVTIPALRATLRVAPTVRDQEVVAPQELASSYWEGSGRVSGTFEGKSVTGLSYTELTGYAGRPAAGNP
jgi:predicted secreted hydrolase